MILTRLVLTNFGVFRGEQRIDLTPLPRRPIILFGGLNGAGKTTILEAIRLCLYGASSLGRVSREGYAGYLTSRIHTNPNLPLQPTFASVAVSFQYSDLGTLHEYCVTRSWQRSPTQGHTDDLRITRDNAPLDDVASENWQDFVQELIPIGVSQLFFFDGERIQQLAEDGSDQQALAEAMKALLGLDLIERLHADLSIYQSRLVKPARGSPRAEELEEIATEIDRCQTVLMGREGVLREARARVKELQDTVSRLEGRLRAEGGTFARKRDDVLRRQGGLRAKIEQHEEAIRQRCGDLLPFALASKLCQQLKDQVLAEEHARERAAARNTVGEARKRMARRVKDSTFWSGLPSLSPSVRRTLASRILQLADETLRVNGTETAIIHELSPAVQRQLLGWLDQIAELPEAVAAIGIDLERAHRELHRLEETMRRAPAEDTLKPTLDELREAQNSLITASTDALRAEEEAAAALAACDELERRYRAISTEISTTVAQQARLVRVTSVRRALDDYRTRLLERRITQLQEHVTACFNALARKKDALRRVTIDPRTFVVTLWDRHNRSLPKIQLSAGEKQIYAVSMLWALAKTSGRPLPMIIDTPLARLDSAHRRLLVEQYLQRASHQVVLLSTDTEIDRAAFVELQTAVSRAYRVEFDMMEGCTAVTPGYFWGEA